MEEKDTLVFLHEEHNCEDVLDGVILCELIEFQRKNNPKLKGMSGADIAEACDMSESTYKGLIKGKNRNPRVGTLVRLLKYIGGGSIDRMVGLAPPRDFAREEAVYDRTLVETLQARLDAKKERIDEYALEVDELQAENEKLRNELVEALKELSAEKTKSATTMEHKIRAHKYACAFVLTGIVLLFVLALIIFVLCDAMSADFGFIGGILWR
jgi:transcriptional regulator with XRE-family HTH domain